MAWLPGYSKRKPLTLTGGASGAQTDFQLSIAVSYEAAMQGDFDDIRFTRADGTTLVDAWAEVIINGTSATIWVEFPITDALGVDRAHYMYYGNAGVGSAYNFDNTFTKDYGESGLIGLWHADDGSGTTVTENSGGGANNGSLVGSPTWVGADGGQWNGQDVQFSTGDSIDFPGGAVTTNLINIADNAALDVTSVTIMIWAKPDVLASGRKIITRDDASSNRIFQMYESDADGDIQMILSTVANQFGINMISTTNPFTAGSWHLIAATYDSGTGQGYLYVDGVEVGNDTDSGNMRAGAIAIKIGGCQATGGSAFDGKMDETRYYNRALSLSEITRYYKRSKYAANPPTYVFGSEESAPTEAAPTAVFYGPFFGPFRGPI
jgi:hypothetical protein